MIDLTRLGTLLRPRRAAASPDDGQGVDVGTAEDGTAVRFPPQRLERAGHVAVLASSGAGKTALVAGALVAEIEAAAAVAPAARPCFFVCDPKADLVHAVLNGVLALAERGINRLADVVYLNPFEVGFPFNLAKLPTTRSAPLDVRAMQLASLVGTLSTSAASATNGGTGARQVDVLTHTLLGALDSDHPAASILWAYDALSVPESLPQLAAATRSARARQFLLTAKLSDELRASTAARLRACVATTTLERMLSAESCISFGELTSAGKIVLCDLGSPPGGLLSLQQFFANLLVRLYLDALLERPSPWRGHPARVAIDEAQVVAEVLADRFEHAATTGRSRAISLTVLSQGTTLIHEASPALLKVLLTNTPTKFIGRLSAADSELLARDRAPSLGSDLPIGQVRAAFAASVCNLPDRTFYALTPGAQRRFVSAEVDLAGWEQTAEARVSERDAVRQRLALPEHGVSRVSLFDVSPRNKRRRGARPGSSDGAPDGTPPSTTTPARPRSRWG